MCKSTKGSVECRKCALPLTSQWRRTRNILQKSSSGGTNMSCTPQATETPNNELPYTQGLRKTVPLPMARTPRASCVPHVAVSTRGRAAGAEPATESSHCLWQHPGNHVAPPLETRRDETRRDETRRDETRRDETRRDETMLSMSEMRTDQ